MPRKLLLSLLAAGAMQLTMSAQNIGCTTQVEMENQNNTDIISVNRLWKEYLESRPDSLYNNPYWNRMDKERYKSYDLLRSEGYYGLYHLSKYGDLRNLVLSTVPIEDDCYDIRSMFYWPGETPFVIAITHVIAKKEQDGEFRLYNWLHYYSSAWKERTAGKITYHFFPEYRFNQKKAEKAGRFIMMLEDKFDINVNHVDVYISKGHDDTERLKGFDYTLASTVVSDGSNLGGSMDIDNNIIYSNASKGEFYEHELMRLLIPFYPRCHWMFMEGLAEYYTEDLSMRGVPIQEHFRRLDRFLDGHKDIDLNETWTFETGNIAECEYLLGLVLVYMTMEKGGLELLKKGMDCGRGDADLKSFMAENLGIMPDEINAVFRSLIHKFATDGFVPLR